MNNLLIDDTTYLLLDNNNNTIILDYNNLFYINFNLINNTITLTKFINNETILINLN